MSLQDLIDMPTKEEYTDKRLRAYDDGSTEMETLLLLYALVRRFKPVTVIETGTYKGFGTVWLAQGLKDNGVGMLWTYDKDECAGAREMVQELGLQDYVTFEHGKTQDAVLPSSCNIDLIFHDADKNPDPLKQEMMKFTLHHLRVEGLAIIHDANKSGLLGTLGEILPVTEFTQLNFTSARGLVICQRILKDTAWTNE